MHELRQKMIREFKNSTKELTPNQKEDRMLEIRDQFIPEKKQKLLESRNFPPNNKNIKKCLNKRDNKTERIKET